MAAVAFRRVDKTYPDGTRALRDLDLTVADGEMMVLVGPSGCGKSTALRLLAGLDPVSAGAVWIDDECVNGLSPQQRDVAMVFQNYALYPHMTVRRNLEFPLRMMHLAKSEIRSRVGATASLLGLTELLERRPRQLSGGQRQRVAMGRAMVRQPRVFLMDEPLSNLDAKLRTQIRAEIANLQRRLGVTTLYVTHDQVEAMTLGDRIAVLEAGRLQQVGPPQELYDRPANAFVAAFLGNPGMNIIPARLSRETGLLQLASSRWHISVERLATDLRTPVEQLEGPILVGLRPEAFSPRLAPASEVIVETVESLGHERLVYFRPAAVASSTEQKPLVARLPGPQAEMAGQSIELGFDCAQLHFFTEQGGVIA
jgi:multiple sugar transport system ATP-binding protein